MGSFAFVLEHPDGTVGRQSADIVASSAVFLFFAFACAANVVLRQAATAQHKDGAEDKQDRYLNPLDHEPSLSE